jgi:hypothetical protein
LFLLVDLWAQDLSPPVAALHVIHAKAHVVRYFDPVTVIGDVGGTQTLVLYSIVNDDDDDDG